MKTRIGFLALGLFLVGCGGSQTERAPIRDIGVWVDPSVSQWHVTQGAAIWENFSARVHLADSRETADARFVPVLDGCATGEGAHFVMGWTNTDSHVTSIRMDCLALMPDPNLSLMTLSAHEFGHQLGLDHVSDSSALMYGSPNIWDAPVLNQSDKAEFCRVLDCDRELQ